MNAFKALVALTFKSMLLTTSGASAKGRGKKRKSISGISAFLLLSFLCIYISSIYSYTLASAFSVMGGLDIMLMLMCMLGIFFPTAFILFAAQSAVYSTKDIDLVLALPVSAFSVMLARVLALYIQALAMCQLLLLPAGVVYLVFGGEANLAFIPLLILLGILFAFVASAIALLFGAVISLVVSRSRHKNLLSIVFSLLFTFVIMGVSFGISFGAPSLLYSDTSSVSSLRATLLSILPPLEWVYSALMGDILSFLLIALLCLLPFFALVFVLSRFYKPLLTLLASHSMRKDYTLGTLSASGSFASLLKKEAGRFFSSSAYVLNCGIGGLLVLVASVAAVIFKSSLADFTSGLAAAGLQPLMDVALPAIIVGFVAFFGSLSSISGVSISLEGKTLWILKCLPISVYKIFAAKIGFSALFGIAFSLVCIPLLGFAFSLPLPTILLMLLLGILFPFFTSALGLLINLHFPRLDAENDTVVIKQSASVIINMLADFVLILALLGLFMLTLSLNLGFFGFGCATAVLLLVLIGVVLWLLHSKGPRIFASL